MKIKVFISNSASKKAQENAKILFGSKGASILTKLEEYKKEKLLNTEHLDNLISYLSKSNSVDVEKFADSAGGKKVKASFTALSKAKTFKAILKALKVAKIPSKALSATLKRTSTKKEGKLSGESLNRSALNRLPNDAVKNLKSLGLLPNKGTIMTERQAMTLNRALPEDLEDEIAFAVTGEPKGHLVVFLDHGDGLDDDEAIEDYDFAAKKETGDTYSFYKGNKLEFRGTPNQLLDHIF